MRCGTSGASGHVTAKPSIGKRGVLYKSGVYARKALCLTPGGLSCALPMGGAEARVIDPDRMGAAVALWPWRAKEVRSLPGRSSHEQRREGILVPDKGRRPERYERVSRWTGEQALHRRIAWWPCPKGLGKGLLRRSG
jgi:hypothetical protein